MRLGHRQYFISSVSRVWEQSDQYQEVRHEITSRSTISLQILSCRNNKRIDLRHNFKIYDQKQCKLCPNITLGSHPGLL